MVWLFPERHYQPFIPVSVLAVKAGDYPELRLKAWTSRVLTTFLSVCLQDLCKRVPNDKMDDELMLATVAMTKLSDWLLKLEMTPRYMTRVQANDLDRLAWEFPGFLLQCLEFRIEYVGVEVVAVAVGKNG